MSFRSVRSLFRRAAMPLRRGLCWLTGGSWRRAAAGVALLTGLAGVTAALLASLGLVPISASSGHWKATGWMLHYVMRRAVSTQSMGIEVPPLDDPALVLKGAGHYQTGCLACHGAPGRKRSLIVRQMTPEPPFLPPRIAHWEPQELFLIVKHGVKFTAMPAWPAPQRDDEVWAMVAFLQALPGMSEQRYRELALGDRTEDSRGSRAAESARPRDDVLAPVLADCSRCHGVDGNGRGGLVPRLTGQSQAYLHGALRAYARGQRHSGIMQSVAAGLEPSVLKALARHYARLPVPARADEPQASAEALERGRTLAERGVPERGVPSCVHCHGPKRSPRNPMYPGIAGQYSGYLKQQLELFTAGQRGGSEYANVMHSAAQRLTPEQMQAVADYYASLPPDASPSLTEEAPNPSQPQQR
jgi:cytochrome c553